MTLSERRRGSGFHLGGAIATQPAETGLPRGRVPLSITPFVGRRPLAEVGGRARALLRRERAAQARQSARRRQPMGTLARPDAMATAHVRTAVRV